MFLFLLFFFSCFGSAASSFFASLSFAWRLPSLLLLLGSFSLSGSVLSVLIDALLQFLMSHVDMRRLRSFETSTRLLIYDMLIAHDDE